MPKARLHRSGRLAEFVEQIAQMKAGETKVQAGLPAGTDSDILMRGVWAEFGTRTQPERPFLRNAMRANRAAYKPLLRDLLRRALTDAAQGNPAGISPQQALQQIGAKAAGDIQNEMGGTPPPNAPSTIQRKGSSTTLIDSGQLRQAITWRLGED